jgi:murein DD-endopeptidase MepM/ murein hydrolase activator NlpD
MKTNKYGVAIVILSTALVVLGSVTFRISRSNARLRHGLSETLASLATERSVCQQNRSAAIEVQSKFEASQKRIAKANAPTGSLPLVVATIVKNGGYGAKHNGHSHNGIDFVTDISGQDTVYAMESGEVTFAGKHDVGRCGREVLIDHGSSSKARWSRYCHLDYYSVQAGQKVTRGTGIGVIEFAKKDPESMSPKHLHFEAIDTNGKQLDPCNDGIFDCSIAK